MQAIITEYFPSTEHLGRRIKAKCEWGSITIPLDDTLYGEGAHIAAAQALVDKFVKEDAQRYGTEKNPWTKRRVVGWIKNGIVAHVFVE